MAVWMSAAAAAAAASVSVSVPTARVAVSESTDGDIDAGTRVERDDGSVGGVGGSVDVGAHCGGGSVSGGDGGMRAERGRLRWR